MITLQEVLQYHHQVVLATGSADGVRDRNILESALNRPFQSFGGEEFYPSVGGESSCFDGKFNYKSSFR